MFFMLPLPPRPTLFPYTTLFRSRDVSARTVSRATRNGSSVSGLNALPTANAPRYPRSEEHTSELQSRQYLVCRLLLEKKKMRAPRASQTVAPATIRDSHHVPTIV